MKSTIVRACLKKPEQNNKNSDRIKPIGKNPKQKGKIQFKKNVELINGDLNWKEKVMDREGRRIECEMGWC